MVLPERTSGRRRPGVPRIRQGSRRGHALAGRIGDVGQTRPTQAVMILRRKFKQGRALSLTEGRRPESAGVITRMVRGSR